MSSTCLEMGEKGKGKTRWVGGWEREDSYLREEGKSPMSHRGRAQAGECLQGLFCCGDCCWGEVGGWVGGWEVGRRQARVFDGFFCCGDGCWEGWVGGWVGG